jgi:hypothetical protein
MEHFDDNPFNRSHAALSEIDKVHRWRLTELERSVLRHCQAIISSVHNVAKSRHYAEQSTEQLAEETASCL